MHSHKILLTILTIALIAIIAYAAMHALFYFLPMGAAGNTGSYAIATALVIVIGLSAPYWMLKIGMVYAQQGDREEDPITMRDIPKDQDQLAHSHKHTELIT